ncbi:hypothetical protein [Nocardia gipuzkoensis]|uniref:hypothetical protein n=1 Tax=Nocardia gipuzkoensis TaxID=2749991 RepID=UPI0015EE89AB|nr:hypothetical protein [Nocardia gipuzkoensis]
MSILRFPLMIAALLVATLGAGCSDHTGSDVHEGDKEAIATIRSGLQTMFTWHPGPDQGRTDAYRRAAPWLTADLAAESGNSTERGPGAQWDQWARDRSTVEATVLIMGTEHDPDTSDRLDRLVLITQAVKTPEGTIIETTDLDARVFVQRTAQGWRISSIEFV